MKVRYKRWLAAVIAASMSVIPALPSLAAEETVFPSATYPAEEGLFPAYGSSSLTGAEPAFGDPGFGEWSQNGLNQGSWDQNGWVYGLASPSDMPGGFMPGGFPVAPDSLWGIPGGFTDGFGGAENDFGSALPPDMMPPADPEDHYITEGSDNDAETGTADASEAEESVDEAETAVYEDEEDEDLSAEKAEEEVDSYEYEDGDYYAKLLAYNFSGIAPADELLAGYINELFYGKPDDTLFTDYWRSTLNSDEREFYDDVREFIGEIAAADEGYPIFDASGITPTLRLSREMLGLSDSASNTDWYEAAMNYYLKNVINARQVLNCVYLDSPYDLYWADRSFIVAFTAYIENGYCVITMPAVYFPAGTGYEGDYVDDLGKYEIYYISNGEIQRARYAADIARAVADDHEGESAAEMAISFAEEINELAPYDPAGEDESSSGDPWQIVYLFDTDPSTAAGSEGYAQAFQYLCDICGFEDCYTITGKLSGRDHVWNVVELDGVYYIVDLAGDDAAALIPVGSQSEKYKAGEYPYEGI